MYLVQKLTILVTCSIPTNVVQPMIIVRLDFVAKDGQLVNILVDIQEQVALSLMNHAPYIPFPQIKRPQSIRVLLLSMMQALVNVLARAPTRITVIQILLHRAQTTTSTTPSLLFNVLREHTLQLVVVVNL